MMLLGHIFPIFYRFQGGKGIASTWGFMFVISWKISLFLLLIWALLFKIMKISSLPSLMIFCLISPIVVCSLYGLFHDYTIWVFLIACLLVWTHRANIRDLWHGRERYFCRGRD